MIAKLVTLLALVAVCLAFPAEEPKPFAGEGPVDTVDTVDTRVPPPQGPEAGDQEAGDLQTDNTFWYGHGRSYHHHHYPVYSYYRPRTYSYYSYYEPYHYHSGWW